MMYLVLIPLMLLAAAGFGYTVYTDLKEHKDGPPVEIDAETIQERQAAEKEIAFFNRQLELLKQQEADINTIYKAAIETTANDEKVNQYCMVVPQKLVIKHINERDKASNKLYTVRNKIYALELKKIKARAKIG